MAIFKCKMCGGTIEFEQGATVGVCDSCGTKQTLPRLDDDRKANLYDRANHFRRNNEFDKAMGIYEQILNEDSADAEAYWSLVLCKYGIEYVEDPATHKRVPTVNRAQYTSIFADEDYKSAIEHADGYQKDIYESEAKAIDEIQKGILDISSKEEPFDVFICYKETDANGRRTPDSVLATELYHELTRDGFKVFFSRITLEDKLGQEYEPYIFAALNSAKVMVVLGTKAEHFNAVWVKNEWSRYLSLIKNGARKILIPAYKDMDPYDLPEEFSHLQAQDMSRLGFMQDLVRGIKKMVSVDEQKPVVKETVINTDTVNIAPLLKRAFIFLEDGDWQSADEYCEKVLDQDPENGEAYLGKLMAELKVHKQEQLADCAQPFGSSNNFLKAVRYGDAKLSESLKNCLKCIVERNENARLEGIYTKAKELMENAETEELYNKVSEILKTIPGYKDADVLVEQCLEKAEVCRKDKIYNSAKYKAIGEIASNYDEAISLFQMIPGWRDSEEQIAFCRKRIQEINEKEENERKESIRQAKEKAEKEKRRKRIIVSIISIIVILSITAVVYMMVLTPIQKYNKASILIDKKEYKEAYELLQGVNYKDSHEKQEKIKWKYQKEILSDAEVASTVKIGHYKQGYNSTVSEDVEWIVLDKKDGKVLIISKYILDNVNWDVVDVDWDSLDENETTEALKIVLKKNNEYLFKRIFSTEETENLIGSNNSFIMFDWDMLEKYEGIGGWLRTKATDYALNEGLYKSDSGNSAWYFWDDGPGFNKPDDDWNEDIDYEEIGIRPAVWIDLGELDG